MSLYCNETFQLVFLVDLSIFKCERIETSGSVDIFNVIKQSVIKILTYFAYKLDDNARCKSLSWGYKFYNGLTEDNKRCLYCLKEYSLTHINSFEKDLLSSFQNEQSKWERKSYLSEDDDGDLSDDQATILARTLTEVLSDFQWDRPDISSPVRPLRRNGRISCFEADVMTRNHVILLSRCPHSQKELSIFTDSNNISVNAVMESFMPVKLHRHFYQENRIKLFWVDLPRGDNQLNDINNIECISVLHSVLKQLDGGILPYQAVLNMGTLSTMHIKQFLGPLNANEYTDINVSQSLVLPVSLILNYYMKIQTNGVNERLNTNSTIANLCVTKGM